MAISLEQEVRCGYTVTPKLKKIWNIELDLLSHLLDVCKKYDLKIMVFGGTLLGAVRHKGFIPWDDDLDVALPREDYEKLCEIGPKEFASPLFFQTALTDNKFFFEYARLRDSNSTGLVKWNVSTEYNNGIFIDIYPLDGYIDDEKQLKKQCVEKKIVKQFLATYNADSSYKSKKPAFVTKMIKVIARTKPYEYWYEKMKKVLTRYNGRTDRLTIMSHDYDVLRKYWVDGDAFENMLWVPFENITVPIPRNYDATLRRPFNDYMQFPPVEERGAWHSKTIIFEPDIPYQEFLKTYEG